MGLKGLSPGMKMTVLNFVSLAKGCYALATRGTGSIYIAAHGECFSSLHPHPRVVSRGSCTQSAGSTLCRIFKLAQECGDIKYKVVSVREAIIT
jgi:hypothetical protein